MANYLLLRGWAREKRHWGPFPEKLGSTAFMLDLPGVGTEYNRLCPTTLDGMVEDIRYRWIHETDKDESRKNVIIGISLGGMIALRWVQMFPQDFQGSVVINTSIADYSKPWERLKLTNLKQLIETIGEKDAVKRERQVLRMTTRLPAEDINELAKLWGAYAEEYPISTRNILAQVWAAAKFRLEIPPKSPVLVLASRQDPFVNPLCSEAFSRHTGAPLRWHPRAGHDLTLEDPVWAAKKIREFSATI